MKEHHNNEGNPAFSFFSHISLILEFFKKQENGKREPPAPGGGGEEWTNIIFFMPFKSYFQQNLQ